MSEGRKVKQGKKELAPREYGFDYTLLMAIVLLVTFGLIMLYSISYNTGVVNNDSDRFYFDKQATFAVIGLLGMLLASKLYPLVCYFKTAIYYISVVLVIAVAFIGDSAGGATRWIDLGFIRFQPSEIVKVGLILYIPWLLSREKTQQLSGVPLAKIIFGYIGIPCILVLGITTNLSTAIIIAGIGCAMTILVTKHGIKYMLGIIAIGVGALILTKLFGEGFLTMNGDFRMERILVWIDVDKYAQQGGYQVLQSLYAIGAGGLFGKGLGNGLQKVSSIPEVQNDMIFAAICEELGLFGVAVVFLLFGIILYRLYKITINAPTLYDSLVVAGIFAHIAIQVIFNIAVVTTVFPNTGVTLPFISYGGTALLIVMCELGLALGVSSR